MGTMEEKDRFRIGVISTTHGVSGEVKVRPTTDDLRRFRDLERVIADTGKGERELHVLAARYSKDQVILKFAEFSNANEVEPLRGAELYVTRADAIDLDEGEYFIADLVGMRVVSTEGELLGTLADVIRTGANDVYVVTDPEGKELLFPAIRDCVKNIDTEAGVITVYVMPGL